MAENYSTYILAFHSRPPFEDQGGAQSAEAPENWHTRMVRFAGLPAPLISADCLMIFSGCGGGRSRLFEALPDWIADGFCASSTISPKETRKQNHARFVFFGEH